MFLKKGVFTDKTILFQLFVVLTFLLTGVFVCSFLGMSIFYACYGIQTNIFDYPDMLRLLQFFTSIGTFLIPAIGSAWLCSSSPRHYLSIATLPDSRLVLLGIFALLFLIPTINLTEILNSKMEFPDFLAPIEAWMRQMENTGKTILDLLIKEDGILPLISNLIVIAVTAAVTEELFFRGTLQQLTSRLTNNPHVIIWTVAAIFSAFHLQFFGFLPRLLLGAYMGYLLFWSKSIWLPVLAHFINNAIAVIVFSNDKLTESATIIEEKHLLVYSIVALCMLGGFFFCCKQMKKAGERSDLH